MPYGPAAPWYNPVKNVPIIGKAWGRIGQVYTIWSQPCDVTPWILIKAAWVSTPRLLWSLFQPDFLDYKYDNITKNFKRHGRRGRFRIHEISYPKYPVPKGLGWALFAGAEFAQRVGWWFCVIDATGEFIVNWSTMTYQYAGCRAPGVGYGSCSTLTPNVLRNSVDGGSFITHNMKLDYEQYPVSAGPDAVSAAACRNYIVGCSYTSTPATDAPGPPTSATGTITMLGDFDYQVQEQSVTNPNGSTTSTAIVEINSPNALTLFFQVLVKPGVGWWRENEVSIFMSATAVKLALDPLPGLKPIRWPGST